MKKRITILTKITSLCILTLSSLHAEESATPIHTNDVQFLPEVVIVGSKDAVNQLPSSGDFINRNEIRMHNYDNVHQVLRRTTGVYVQEETGLGLLPNISLRGVDSHRSQKITIMEDGVLTAPAPYSAPSAYYAPTMGRMSGLEVLKGSSQVKYGPHTTGGAINYLSTPIPDFQTGYMKMLYGSHNELRGHAYYGNTIKTDAGRFGGLVEVYHHQTDGFKTIKHASDNDKNTGFKKTDYMVKLGWDLEDTHNQRFELKLGYTEFDANETYLGLSEEDFKDDPFQRYYASRFDNFTGEHFRSYLKHFIELTENSKLATTLYYHKFHRNWYKLNDIKNVKGLPKGAIPMANALAAGGPALATLKGENSGIWRVRANNRDYNLWGAESVFDHNFDAIGAKHDVELGLRYHQDQADRFQWQDEISVDDNGAVTDIAYGKKGAAGNRLQTARAISLFIEDDMKWARLTVTPGIRGEYISNEVTDYNKNNGTLSDHETAYAAGISAKYQLTEEALIFSGIYRGYSIPSPNDNINKGVTEETSISGELGTRYAKEGLSVQFSGYYTALNDLIVGGYVGNVTDTDTENAGNINSYGAELKLEINPGILNDWNLSNPIWLAYTYTHATLDGDTTSKDPGSIFAGGKDGNRVPYIPDNQISAGYGIGYKKLTWEITATYIDATYSTANNSTEQINPVTGKPDSRFGEVDSRFIVDTSAQYDLHNNLSLFVNAQNLFNNEYMASRHPYGPRPGMPLTVMAGLEASF